MLITVITSFMTRTLVAMDMEDQTIMVNLEDILFLTV